MRILGSLMLLMPLAMMAQRPVPIDNEWARVVIATSAPSPKGRMHRHDVNRVMVYLDKGAQRIEYEDGAKRDIPFGPGDVKWDPKGGMHTSENTGGTTFRVVEIELKTDGGAVKRSKSDPLSVAPGVFRLEIENDQIRVLRVKLSANQVVEGYEAAVPRIIVPLTEIDLRTSGAAAVIGQPGTAIYDSSRNDRMENVRNRAVEFLVIDLKGAQLR